MYDIEKTPNYRKTMDQVFYQALLTPTPNKAILVLQNNALFKKMVQGHKMNMYYSMHAKNLNTNIIVQPYKFNFFFRNFNFNFN